jgi:hypothetical protein
MAIFLSSLLIYQAKYSGKIYPNTLVAGINISGMTKEEASTTLSQQIKTPEKINLKGPTQSTEVNIKDIELVYDFNSSVERAYNLTRVGNPFLDWQSRAQLIRSSINLGLKIQVNEEKLAKIISVVSGQNSTEAIEPTVKLVNGKIQVNKGSAGIEVDQLLLRAKIGEGLSFAKNDDIEIPVNKIDNS